MLALLFALHVGCGGEEAAIRGAFADAAEAVAEKRMIKAASAISRRYSDPRGLTYESFLGSLNMLFETYDELEVPHRVRSISISGETATVTVAFRLIVTQGGDKKHLIGSPIQPATADILVRKVRGTWIIETVERLEIP